ncbi:MAG TPA: hypothetical protein VJ781_03020, partial [Pyrinomonadaceae bacterium]|nr:hypothetical protein [Pyrinomonadaceae bacterium]
MRDLISSYDRRFAELSSRQRELILTIDEELLYARTGQQKFTMLPASVGEFILRSVAAVEQMIGGITTRLWDDPFEWTLPEQLPARGDVLKYIEEVEQSRLRGFSFFSDDEDLNKLLPAPVEFQTLGTVLEDT